MPRKPARKLKGRERLAIMLAPKLLNQLKRLAKAETKENGGAIRRGGKGRISVSDIIERWVKDRLAAVLIVKPMTPEDGVEVTGAVDGQIIHLNKVGHCDLPPDPPGKEEPWITPPQDLWAS